MRIIRHLTLYALIGALMLMAIGCENTPATKTPEAEEKQTQPEQVLNSEYEDLRIDFTVKDGFCEKWNAGALEGGVSTAQDIIKLFGEPDEETKPEPQGYDNRFHKTLIYKDKGIIIGVKAENEEASFILSSISFEAPFSGKTAQDIGVGSSEAKVREAYAQIIDKESDSPHMIVVGNSYGGVFFGIENGVVTSISLGAGAE